VPTLIDIADAVVAELNGTSGPKVGQPPTALNARRFYRPVFDLAEMKDLHVTVVPKGLEMRVADRTLVQHDCSIDVAVQKKLQTADNAEIDGLMALVEEIADFFRLRRLVSQPNAIWVRTENSPVYSQEHLEQLRQFTSVLTLTFRVLR